MKAKTIWKYELGIIDLQEIYMPKGSDILSVQVQQSTLRPCMWVLVDPTCSDMVARRFRIFGTGHQINVGDKGDLNYIGTFQTAGGSLVFHIFEEAC
jgi:hypothetical protein